MPLVSTSRQEDMKRVMEAIEAGELELAASGQWPQGNQVFVVPSKMSAVIENQEKIIALLEKILIALQGKPQETTVPKRPVGRPKKE